MFIGRRDKRIDRALANALSSIDREHDELRYACDAADPRAEQVLLDCLAIAMDKKRLDAYVRADTIRAQWQARIEAMENDE
jgi:hypothetical protein